VRRVRQQLAGAAFFVLAFPLAVASFTYAFVVGWDRELSAVEGLAVLVGPPAFFVAGVFFWTRGWIQYAKKRAQ
jgi:hypothetical protein